jgi:hypothetical protein
MDFILFFKILTWIGFAVSGLGVVWSVVMWHHFEHTSMGKLEHTIMKLQGSTIVGYYFTRRLAIFVICSALLVSFN